MHKRQLKVSSQLLTKIPGKSRQGTCPHSLQAFMCNTLSLQSVIGQAMTTLDGYWEVSIAEFENQAINLTQCTL